MEPIRPERTTDLLPCACTFPICIRRATPSPATLRFELPALHCSSTSSVVLSYCPCLVRSNVNQRCHPAYPPHIIFICVLCGFASALPLRHSSFTSINYTYSSLSAPCSSYSIGPRPPTFNRMHGRGLRDSRALRTYILPIEYRQNTILGFLLCHRIKREREKNVGLLGRVLTHNTMLLRW